jgi:hypothetical protein
MADRELIAAIPDDRNATHTGNSAKPSAGQKQPGHRC